MKTKFLQISIFFLAIVLLVSCGKSKEEMAEEAVNNFMKSLIANNIDSAKNFSNSATHKILEKVNSDRKKCEKHLDTLQSPIKYEIAEKKMEDDGGTVKIRISTPFEERTETFFVAKENEQWLLSLENRHIGITRFVVFRGFYEICMQLYDAEQAQKKKDKPEKKKSKKGSSKKKHK